MENNLKKFQEELQEKGNLYFRNMQWRETVDPYKVLISEIMLQQTQVHRVVVKYAEFIQAFPTVQSLAKASFKDVLKLWSGLGYNRRALWLHESAKIIVNKYKGKIPSDRSQLEELPGIGPNTAAAIIVYSFNKPEIFIETNIRSVFIHEFFHGKDEVRDKDILPLIEKTIDIKNPRVWYWALMDYGSVIKKATINPSRKSKHYTKQSAFEGSNRQVRGQILRYLLQDNATLSDIATELHLEKSHIKTNLDRLKKEDLIVRDRQGVYSVSS